MGRQTKIDWCDSSWNPVTGCKHGCTYCYARGIANRFGGFDLYGCEEDHYCVEKRREYVLNEPALRERNDGVIVKAPYPFKFEPTLHRYKLDEPQEWKRPHSIFVCSMADLFGEWVPVSWILEVLAACKKATRHRYIFLTKNPARYISLMEHGLLPTDDNFWYGSTATTPDTQFFFCKAVNTFVSIEPIHQPFKDLGDKDCFVDWVIVGAETGHRKGKIIPQKEWIDELASSCKKQGIPIFMKDSLKPIMGDDFRQEFPWE